VGTDGDSLNREGNGAETTSCLRGMNEAKAKGTFLYPSLLPFDSEEQKERGDYECRTRPEDFAFRKATNARPRRPVPSNNRDEGSGVGTGSRETVRSVVL